MTLTHDNRPKKESETKLKPEEIRDFQKQLREEKLVEMIREHVKIEHVPSGSTPAPRAHSKPLPTELGGAAKKAFQGLNLPEIINGKKS